MTKTRARHYWQVLKHARDLSPTEAELMRQVIQKLNEPVRKRLTKPASRV